MSVTATNPEHPKAKKHEPQQCGEDVGGGQDQEFGAWGWVQIHRVQDQQCRGRNSPRQKEDHKALELLGKQLHWAANAEGEPPVRGSVANGRQQQGKEIGLLCAKGSLENQIQQCERKG
ncbi:hypothetical protein GCM10007170_13580 [Arthrobacter liuii]|uniref:Uncharacterized protein n=1 Tax=Arthrobacter liuii TaxID=1476996 RepID=A0ABQ2ALE2_9MICC|nr:hypothetical protein GCM10007170_13580 [Arthrobacter liuii]